MARRERRTYSRLPVTSEQRRQADQGRSRLRVEPLFRLSAFFVAYGPLAVCVLLSVRETKNRQQRDTSVYLSRLLGINAVVNLPQQIVPLPERQFRSLHNPAALRRRDRIAEI